MANESIGEVYVKIGADISPLERDYKKIISESEKTGKSIEDSFKKHKIDMDTDLAKKSLNDLKVIHKALLHQLNQKVEFGADNASIKKTEIGLESTEAAMKKLKEETKQTSSAFSKLKGFLGAIGLGFGAYKITAFLQDSIRLAGIQEQAEKKLETALGRKSQSLLDYASALQKATTYGDEQIIQAQALIAAFVKDENQIKSLTKATLDLAAAKGMDLVSAADLISKTIGSSTNALSRYGIEVEGAAGSTERMESAVSNITNLFGGQAEAAANTYSGQMQQLNNELGDMKETIGKELVAEVIQVSKEFRNFAKELIAFNNEVKQVTGGLGILSASIKGLKEIIRPGSFAGDELGNTVDRLATRFKVLLETGQAVDETKLTNLELEIYKQVKALVDANKKAEEFRKTLNELPESFKNVDKSSVTFANILGSNQKSKQQVTEILEKIKQLEEANSEGNLTLEKYQSNLKEIDRLQNILNPKKEEEKKIIDELVKKVKNENDLKELTTGLSNDILELSKKTLETQLAITQDAEDKLKLLRAIEDITKKIAENKPPEIELPEGLKTEDIDITDAELKGYEDRKEAERTIAELRLSAIDNEFQRREEEINARYELELENLNNLALTEGELKEAQNNLDKTKENELAQLQQQRFQAGLSAAQSIAGALSRIVGSGNAFVSALQTALEVAEAIAATLQAISIIGSLFSLGGTSAISAATGGGSSVIPIPGMASGGDVNANKIYKVGERGPELFIPNSSGVIIPNHLTTAAGTSNLQSSGLTSNELRELIDAVKAMNMNLVRKDFNVSVINTSPDVETTVTRNERTKNRLTRAGKKFEQE